MPDQDKLRKENDQIRNEQLMKALRHSAGIGAGWFTLTLLARQAVDLAAANDRKKRAEDLRAQVNAKYPIFTPDYRTDDTKVEEQLRGMGVSEKTAGLIDFFRKPPPPPQTSPLDNVPDSTVNAGIGAAGVGGAVAGWKGSDALMDAYLRRKMPGPDGYASDQALVQARLAAKKAVDSAQTPARVAPEAWEELIKDKELDEFLQSGGAHNPSLGDRFRKFIGLKTKTPGAKLLIKAREAAERRANIISPAKLRNLAVHSRLDITPGEFRAGKAAIAGIPLLAAAYLINKRQDKTAALDPKTTPPTTMRSIIDKFINPIPTDPNQPVTPGALADAVTSPRYHPMHIALTLAALLGGGAAGYKLSNMLSSQREEGALDKRIAGSRNKLDRLFLEEWARTRGVPEKTAAANEDSEGWATRAWAGASKMYLVYAAGMAALAYAMSKKYMDTNDPNRTHLAALQDFAKREARVKDAPVLISDLAVLPPGGKSAVPGAQAPLNMPTYDQRDPLGALKL